MTNEYLSAKKVSYHLQSFSPQIKEEKKDTQFGILFMGFEASALKYPIISSVILIDYNFGSFSILVLKTAVVGR